MTIAVTLLIGPSDSVDLVLPAHVPVALLMPELIVVTPGPVHQLTAATGRPLDPTLSLADNGVRGGAILLTTSADQPAPVVDDLAQLATDDADGEEHPRPDPRGILLGIGVCMTAGLVLRLGFSAVAPWLCLGSMLGWGLAPRLVLRAYRLDASSDPASAGIRARLDAARNAMRWISHWLIACASSGAVVLVHGGSSSVLAGWLVLGAVSSRVAESGAVDAIAAVAAIGAAVVACVPQGDWVQVTAAAAGVVVTGWLLCRDDSGPLGRLVRQAGDRAITLTTPIALLAAAGMVPGAAQ